MACEISYEYRGVICAMKSWVKYLIYISFFVFITFCGGSISRAVEGNDQYVILINVLRIVLYGAMGMVLGSEHLLNEFKKNGGWKINLPKIILMGIPSLYIALSPFIYYSQFINSFLPSLLFPVRVMLWSDFEFLNIFQLLLGYIVATSFYKRNNATGS